MRRGADRSCCLPRSPVGVQPAAACGGGAEGLLWRRYATRSKGGRTMIRQAHRAAWAAGFGLLLATAHAQAQGPQGVDRLSHIVVLYMENRSFDNVFGEFPGANGLANAGEAAIQKD